MPLTLPLDGIYFRKGHFNDRLIDNLLTVKVSVVIITPLGAEEKELTFTGSDLISVIQALVMTVANLGAARGLQVDRMLGGTLPTGAEQRALVAQQSALAEPGP